MALVHTSEMLNFVLVLRFFCIIVMFDSLHSRSLFSYLRAWMSVRIPVVEFSFIVLVGCGSES